MFITKNKNMENNPTPRESLIGSMMQAICEGYNQSHTQIYPMSAIWMGRVIRTSRETKRRLTEDDLILVKDGKIVDCDGEPSHRIVRCEGTLADTIHYFILENLETKEIEKLQLT